MRTVIQDYPRGLRQRAHEHGTAGFSMVLAGSLTERVGSREQAAEALSVVCKPPGTRHENGFGPEGARLLRVTLDPEEASESMSWARALGSWRWIHCGPPTRPFVTLAARVACSRDPAAVDDAVWDALGSIALTADSDPSRVPPRWLSLVHEAIDDGGTAVRVSTLAAGAGVHPVYLARQFRRFYGCSISELVQRRRVRRLATMISARAQLSRAAQDAGFADQPHMCRAFKQATGLTPGEFRQLTARVSSVQSPQPNPS